MLCHPNVPDGATVLMMSLTGHFVAMLTFALKT